MIECWMSDVSGGTCRAMSTMSCIVYEYVERNGDGDEAHWLAEEMCQILDDEEMGIIVKHNLSLQLNKYIWY